MRGDIPQAAIRAARQQTVRTHRRKWPVLAKVKQDDRPENKVNYLRWK